MPAELNVEVIPLKDSPSKAPDRTDVSQPPVVLVVDDEEIIADTLSLILGKNGYSVFTAYNAESALEQARIVPPELLLSDVMLGPGLDGVQLAMKIVRDTPECKVLLFSGHTGTRDLVKKAGEAGRGFTLLTKPLHPLQLLAHIKEVLTK